jgi:hypothetical protein
MKVARAHDIDIEHGSSLHHEAGDFVLVGVMSGSALHGLAEVTAHDTRTGFSEVSAEMVKALDHATVHRGLVGARLPRPVHLESVAHPEVERDLVLAIRPKSVSTAIVRFHYVGRPSPTLVLDDIITDRE